jgi:isopentenyl-diphosphate delta-isomerase
MPNPNQELIVYVDNNGVPTGETAPKLDAHTSDTRLHAAFSCYIFNGDGKILVTRRSLAKKVWPGVWTNSVCGHPAPDESNNQAIVRRADYELGMKVSDIKVILPNYMYKTPPFNGIVENEFCPVYLARLVSNPSPNPDEVADYKWMNWDDFVIELNSDAINKWSFWCKDQVKQFDEKTLLLYLNKR